MVGRKASSLVTTLAATLLLLASYTRPVIAATPVHAQTRLMQFISDTVAGIGDWVDGVWDTVRCTTDIDCLLRNAGVSIGNNAWLGLIGVPFTDLNGENVTAMMMGRWNTGLAFTATGAISSLYDNPPGLRELHFASHVKRELSDNLLSQHASARTAGEALIGAGGPIERIWGAVRDFTYGLFFIIMVAIGFMIMFRKQTPARVTISFTSALPRILISLVLITFSFSIVALVYDVVAVFGTAIANQVFEIGGGNDYLRELSEPLSAGGFAGTTLGAPATTYIGHLIVTVLQPLINSPVETIQAVLQGLIVGTFFLIAFLIVLFLVAIQVCYRGAKLIVAAVFSPLAFLIGSLPGQEGVSKSFLLGVVADCAAFPAIAFMFSLSFLFLINSLQFAAEAIPRIGEGSSALNLLIRDGVLAVFLSLFFLAMAFIAPGKVANAINPKRR